MKILILGGTGAIGKPLISILKKFADNEVYVTSRSERPSSGNVTFLKCNALNTDDLHAVLSRQRWDAVIDFMIYTDTTFRERMEMLLDSTEQYFFLSSATEFAESAGSLTERSPRLLDVTDDQQFLAVKPYPINKALCENYLRASGRRNWTIVRPYITFNSNRLQLGCYEKENWLYRALHGGEVLFSRDIAARHTTLTYAGDVALAISRLIGKSEALGEDFTLTTDKSLTWGEILEVYRRVLRRERGIDVGVKWTDRALNLRFFAGQWHARYDRLFDRRFCNDKLMAICPDLTFEDTASGLDRCLTEFLQKGEFRHIPVPIHGRLAHSYVPIKNVPGWKNKFRQLAVRFMPYPLFVRVFNIIPSEK